ncbi:recombinase family protein [Aestuariivirga litoralis]|uniref:Recombinase family protein n=1 Tax=Aestuariivirga litoralis TaxID=2650924 RepID=A0A2W2APY0_9HYPH|nr:recombinase family protein [Aestuariivirga litoralis]PZF77471.1 recombinase family protein [Aestuariivirga litoralis]
MSTVIGYARVSTADQDLATQKAELKTAGCTVIRAEKVSGASREGRTELQTILDFLRPGDQVVVVRLDRLGRDTRDVLNIVHELKQKGASLRVLSPAIDTSGPTGEIILTVLGMVAQMERQFIKERQKVGIEAAKAKGVYKGGKAKIDLATVEKLKTEGKTMTEIASHFGVTRQGVYKAIKEANF